MIISDLEHLEVIAEGTNVVGSSASLDLLNSALLKSLGYKPIDLKVSTTLKDVKTISKTSGDSKKGSVVSASVKQGSNGVSATVSSASWKKS